MSVSASKMRVLASRKKTCSGYLSRFTGRITWLGYRERPRSDHRTKSRRATRRNDQRGEPAKQRHDLYGKYSDTRPPIRVAVTLPHTILLLTLRSALHRL